MAARFSAVLLQKLPLRDGNCTTEPCSKALFSKLPKLPLRDGNFDTTEEAVEAWNLPKLPLRDGN